jgi:hypothetical protein
MIEYAVLLWPWLSMFSISAMPRNGMEIGRSGKRHAYGAPGASSMRFPVYFTIAQKRPHRIVRDPGLLQVRLLS